MLYTIPMINPQEHDEKIAAAYFAHTKAIQEREVAKNELREQAGQRINYNSRRSEWVIDGHEASIREAYERCEENAEVHNDYERVLIAVEEARKVVQQTYVTIQQFEAQYTGWSRFFLVTSSPGHIHSSMHCSTCRPTTQYGWLPELSGRDEEAAVKECGPTLCSVCFPDAPVDWQDKKVSKKDAERMAWSPDRDEKIAKAEKAKVEAEEKKIRKAASKLKYDESLAHKVNKLVDMFGDNTNAEYEWTWSNKGYDNAHYIHSDMIKRRK